MTVDPFHSPEPDIAWVLPNLAIGSLPYAVHRASIARQGVQVVVSVAEPGEHEASEWRKLGLDFVALPTRDWVAIPGARFDEVVATICRELEAGRTVLLHCLAGINRAPTLAAAILCRVQGLDVDTALEAVRRVRPAARPTPEQEASLRHWLELARRR
jgi:protein-tyrosine phosphatase